MIENIKKRPQALLVGLIVIRMAVIISTSSRYLARLQAKLEEDELQNVMAITLQQRRSLDNFLSNDLERLHSYADHFSRSLISGAGEIEDQLDLSSRGCPSAAGTAAGGKTVPMSEALLEEHGSLTGSGVRDNYLGATSGEPRSGFYETFTYANGHHGLIQKSYERNEIAEAFDLSFFNGRGYGYMLSQDGDILRRSDYVIDDKVYTNIFEALADLDYRQEAMQAASWLAALPQLGEGSRLCRREELLIRDVLLSRESQVSAKIRRRDHFATIGSPFFHFFRRRK